MRLQVTESLTGAQRLVALSAVRAMSWTFRPYQPVVVGRRKVASGKRQCAVRLEAIREVLRDVGADDVRDLGCAEGYFVRSLAEEGYFAWGVEPDGRRLALAQLSTAVDGVRGIGFVNALADVETLAWLPSADVTISMSVLHHVLYADGVTAAVDVLRAIRATTRKALVFECGQSDEHKFEWAARLPDMGPDPHVWLADLLIEAGFRDVVKLCEVPSWKAGPARATFRAST